MLASLAACSQVNKEQPDVPKEEKSLELTEDTLLYSVL